FLARPSSSRRRLSIAFVLLMATLPVGWLVFDRVVTAKEEALRDTTPFAAEVRELAPAPTSIILFRVESHLLAYQLGRPIHTLVEWAELNAELRNTGVHYVVTRAEFLDEIRQHA